MLRFIERWMVRQDLTPAERRRRAFSFFCIVVSLPFIAMFAIEDLLHHRVAEGVFILVVLALLTVNLMAIKFRREIRPHYRLSAFLVLVLLAYELASGGGEGHAFIWFYCYPLAMFYLLGKTEGLFWVGGSFLIAGFFLLLPIGYSYDLTVSLRFLVSYGIMSMFAIGYESARNRRQRQLLREKRLAEDALSQIKTLQGLLPICSHCKSIRDDSGYWNRLEGYIQDHSDAQFSHGVCPTCLKELYPDITIE